MDSSAVVDLEFYCIAQKSQNVNYEHGLVQWATKANPFHVLLRPMSEFP